MRPEKQFLLDEIKDKIDNSSAMVLTKYKGLNPNMAAQFRTLVAKSDGTFEVVRKRILIKAAQSLGIDLDQDALEGHIAVVFANNDPVQVTKTLYDFKKSNEEIFEVLGGRFEGQLCSAKDIEQISQLPTKEQMRAQFLGTLEAPLSQTLAVMEALLTSTLYCLENKSNPS